MPGRDGVVVLVLKMMSLLEELRQGQTQRDVMQKGWEKVPRGGKARSSVGERCVEL